MWAKFDLYPWWPALVLPLHHALIPSGSRRPPADDAVAVWFLGTHDFAWILEPGCVTPWEQAFKTRRKKKVAAFAQSMREALHYHETGGGGGSEWWCLRQSELNPSATDVA